MAAKRGTYIPSMDTTALKAKTGRNARGLRARHETASVPGPAADSGFDSVVKAFAADPEVTPPGAGKGFGSGALKVGKKIFAMVSSRAEFVVKLPLPRAAELVNSGRGRYFDAGRGKPMKEWVVVTGGKRLWIPLAREARDFASGAR